MVVKVEKPPATPELTRDQKAEIEYNAALKKSAREVEAADAKVSWRDLHGSYIITISLPLWF